MTSGRRSAGSCVTRRRTEAPTFIIDENMGSSIAAAFVERGSPACLLTSFVAAGTPDIDFIPRLAQWGQAFVTRDIAMRSNPVEMEALQQCGVHVFLFRAAGLNLDQLRALIADHHASMVRYVTKYTTPFVARVTRNGFDLVVASQRRSSVRRD